jgi:hypothetical protein
MSAAAVVVSRNSTIWRGGACRPMAQLRPMASSLACGAFDDARLLCVGGGKEKKKEQVRIAAPLLM